MIPALTSLQSLPTSLLRGAPTTLRTLCPPALGMHSACVPAAPVSLLPALPQREDFAHYLVPLSTQQDPL